MRTSPRKEETGLRIALISFLVAILLIPGSILTGATPLWAADKAELVVYTVGGSWQEATHEFIGKPFSERYGAKVTYDIRPNTEQVMALQASKNNPLADVIELSHSRLARAVTMGLLAEQDETKVPNRKVVPAKFKTDFFTGRGHTPIILVYNKTKVDDKDCASWDVLTNPKYKNKVAIMKFGWNGEQFLHAVNKVKGGSYDDPTPGLTFCRKVIENGGKVLDSNDHAMRLFESGEIWLAPFYPGRAEELISKGVPLKYQFVPGSLSYLWGFSVVRNAKNTDLY
jgi:putative spermidine/putrescine transport system substrate-binding protein